MYLVVIGVLSLILAFPAPPYHWLRSPGWVYAAVTLATIIPPLAALWFSRRALRELEAHPQDPGLGQFTLGRAMFIAQVLLAICHGAVLTCTDWLLLVRYAPVIGMWPVVPGLLAGLPFLVSIVLIWLAAYPTDRAVRQIALEVYLHRGRPVRPVWPLGRYVMFNLRHQVLFILLPMLLILLARDLIERLTPTIRRWSDHPFLPDLLLGSAAVMVAVIAPLILRYVWVTTPMATGALRDRLEFLCRKLKMGCREILIWQTGGMIVNAAVMGVIAPFRYFLITDALLEQMEDSRLEAVFGHEAGHVKCHHILYFLLFAFISGCLVTVLAQQGRSVDRKTYEIAVAIIGGALLVKWGVLFGMVSRSFERQADVYGVRTLALTGLPCSSACVIHAPELVENQDPQKPPRDALCVSAAQLFGETLREVALLNGIPPESRSWRHGSIADRSRTVLRYAMHPRAVMRFERVVWWIKTAIVTSAVLSGAWAAWELKIWTLVGIGVG